MKIKLDNTVVLNLLGEACKKRILFCSISRGFMVPKAQVQYPQECLEVKVRTTKIRNVKVQCD